MRLNRREFTAAGVSLSALLAGCADAEDDSTEDEESHDEESDDESDAADGATDDADESEPETDDADAEDRDDETSDEDRDDETSDEDRDDESDAAEDQDADEEPESEESGEANESDADDDEEAGDEVYEDESISGEVSLSEAAERHLEVERHTFTWGDEPPHEFCQVHAMLGNASGAEVTATLTVRIYDADGNELSSTTDAEADGPEPGADDAVYSLELNNCPDAAAYELEITDVEADDEEIDPVERHLLRVIVQDGFGEPIDHATVSVEERGLGGWGETEQVDDHGQAEFEFQAGEYALTVTADEYPSLEDIVELTGNMEYTATLRADDD